MSVKLPEVKYSAGTAPAVALLWLEAWGNEDFVTMWRLSQEHWKACRPRARAVNLLESNFGAAALIPMEIVRLRDATPVGVNHYVLRDVEVTVIFGTGLESNPHLQTGKVKLRLLREYPGDRRKGLRRAWRRLTKLVMREEYVPIPNPSPEGVWGVNPTTAYHITWGE